MKTINEIITESEITKNGFFPSKEYVLNFTGEEMDIITDILLSDKQKFEELAAKNKLTKQFVSAMNKFHDANHASSRTQTKSDVVYTAIIDAIGKNDKVATNFIKLMDEAWNKYWKNTFKTYNDLTDTWTNAEEAEEDDNDSLANDLAELADENDTTNSMYYNMYDLLKGGSQTKLERIARIAYIYLTNKLK